MKINWANPWELMSIVKIKNKYIKKNSARVFAEFLHLLAIIWREDYNKDYNKCGANAS